MTTCATHATSWAMRKMPSREKTREMARATDEYVHEHPWRAVGAAAGVGLSSACSSAAVEPRRPGPMATPQRLSSSLKRAGRHRARAAATAARAAQRGGAGRGAARGRLLVYGAVAVTFLSLGVVFLALLITVALWDSHRLLALAAFTGLFLVLGGVAAWLARERVRSGTRLFSASVEELQAGPRGPAFMKAVRVSDDRADLLKPAGASASCCARPVARAGGDGVAGGAARVGRGPTGCRMPGSGCAPTRWWWPPDRSRPWRCGGRAALLGLAPARCGRAWKLLQRARTRRRHRVPPVLIPHPCHRKSRSRCWW